MKRTFLAALSAGIALLALVGVIALVRAEAAQRQGPPLGRYACTRAADGSPLPDLKLTSEDKYVSGDKIGVYAYEAGSGRIEWLTGPMPRRQVGFLVPKGTGEAKYDTIIIRDKRDVEEGIERDLSRCTLAD